MFRKKCRINLQKNLMLPYIHVKNAYKKFHLKDMQMISEDALKNLAPH